MDERSLSAVNEERFSQRTFESRESRLAKALELFAQETSRGRLIDVAAGSGIAAEALTAQGWTVSALDISDALLEQIRARGVEEARRHDLAEGPLPYDDGSFQAAFAGEIVEHLVDTGHFVSELARVLAPGGVVVITTPNLASLENRLRLLAGRYPRWVEWELPTENARPFHDQGHVRSYTPRTLRAQLAEHGLTVEKVVGNWVPLVPQRFVTDLTWAPLARTGDWFPSFSQDLIAKARRRA